MARRRAKGQVKSDENVSKDNSNEQNSPKKRKSAPPESKQPESPVKKLSRRRQGKDVKPKPAKSAPVANSSKYFSSDNGTTPSKNNENNDSDDDFEIVCPGASKNVSGKRKRGPKVTGDPKKVKGRAKKSNSASQDNLQTIPSSSSLPPSIQNEMDMLIQDGKLVDFSTLKSLSQTDALASFPTISDSEASDWEEVEDVDNEENTKNQIPEAPVEITVEGPLLQKKRKKKGFDMEDWFRRQVNKHKKETQINTHKVHLICLLTNGCYRNNTCNRETPQAIALSFVPVDITRKLTSTWTQKDLTRLVSWFCDAYKLEYWENSSENCQEEELISCISQQTTSSDIIYIMMFVTTARALGMETRFMCSMQPISAKSTNLITKGKSVKSALEDMSAAQSTPDKNAVKTEPKGKGKGKGKGKSSCNAKSSKADDKSVKTETDEATKSGTKKKGGPVKRNASSRKCATKVSYAEEKDKKDAKRSSKSNEANESVVISSDDEDFEVVLTQFRTPTPAKSKAKRSKKVLSSDSDDGLMITKADVVKKGIDYWAEVYVETMQSWICVDCKRNRVHHTSEMEKHATKPMYYVLAYENDTSVKDVTKKYVANWMSYTRKLRVDEEWWRETLDPYCTRNGERDATEDLQIQAHLMKKPLPTSISEYKGHPLYALKRHLLKFEGIYPNSAVPLGYVRNEPVYARECVQMLHSRETWLKEGRLVRIGEDPYKMVKARPKWWKTEPQPTEPTLPLFGFWQTEVYIPPPAVDGKVPRNEYGNVELFKPEMLPSGTVHLKLSGLNKIAKKLDIDCVPAMVGWDFHGGYNHAVHDGFVVCEEFKDVLLAAWDEQQEIDKEKEAAKIEKRVLANWKLLTRSLVIRERMKHRFDLDDKKDEFKEGADKSGKIPENKAKDTDLAWPRNRQSQASTSKKTPKRKKEKGTLFPFEVEEM